MSESVSIATGIAARYASAVFDLAKEQGALSALEADIATLDGALSGSDAFRHLTASPLVGREEQLRALEALAPQMTLTELTQNTLKLMASKRRLFVLPQLLAALQGLIAEDRGEVSADVIAPEPLSEAQSARLAEVLASVAGSGKTVKINASVDETLIGGLIIKLGSKMIDTSIRSKLARLGNAMKEVG